MDLQNLPSIPRADATTEKNEELTNALMPKEEIFQKRFLESGDTLLHVVAHRSTLSTAAEICKLGLHVNSQNQYKETPIFYAIKNSTEMVNLLINNGAFLNIKCNSYYLPLQEALLSGNEKTVQLIINRIFADKHESHFLHSHTVQNSEETIRALLDYQEDLFLKGSDYPRLVFFAAKIGDLELFKLVIDSSRKYLDLLEEVKLMNVHPLEELNSDDYFDRKALHYAVQQQVPEVVHFLLKAGADANCTNNCGFTPLHYAAFFENQEICEILLNFGAQINPRDLTDAGCEFFYLSPLDIVCGGDDESLDLYLLQRDVLYENNDGDARSRISNPSHHLKKSIFNLGIMKFLLQHGADSNFADQHDGMTPVLRACKAGRLEPIKLLLNFGANIHTCDYNGNSALHYAADADSFEIVNLLLKSGFDIDIKNRDGATALMIKVQDLDLDEICVDMVEYLVDLGANINASDPTGGTALHAASDCVCPDNIECLLELKADFKVELKSVQYYFNGLTPSRKTLTAFIALKEDNLGDYIVNYVKNERNEISQIRQFFGICKLEVEQLKCVHILENGKFSFYDFLSRDIYSALQIIENKKVRKVFTCEEYKNQFPCYAYLLKKRFKRLELLKKTIDEVVEFLHGYKRFNLPFLIIETILSFLSSSDFRNFGRALSKKLD